MKQIISLIISFILCTGFVLAVDGVTQTDNFYDEDGNPLTGVQSELYTQGGDEHIHSKNSEDSNSITFEYPYNADSTEDNPDYYDHFIFKECYLPKEFTEYVWGGDEHLEYNNTFNKAKSCHSPIDSFSVTNDNHPNEPVVVDVSTSLEADAHSAFTDAELGWFPEGYEEHYSAETEIIVEILHEGDVVYTDSKDANIMMDESENVEFSWTPEMEGDFTARIKTDVTDCQCESSEVEQSSKEFEVWADRPYNECYTLIQDLEAVPEFPKVGDDVEVSFNKISNYADENYEKTPVPTKIDYEITDSNKNLVEAEEFTLDANSDGENYENHSFSWEPAEGGNYNIEVTGIADSSLCDGLTNPEDTANLGVVVDEETLYDVTFNVYNSETDEPIEGASVSLGSQSGTTSQEGRVSFEANPSTYDWSISAQGFESDSGSVTVEDENENVDVHLEPVIDEYSVTFEVVDAATGFGVENALVEFGDWSAETNEDGRAVFSEVEEDNYDWEVSKENYYPASDNLDVNQDELVEVTLEASQCTPGENDTKQCGETDVGVCEYGTQERTCQEDGTWSDWSNCSGAVFPSEEICDGLDNDCDGEVDEGCGPVFSLIPDQSVDENSGLNENLVDLHNYTTHHEDINEVNFSINSQTNTSVVDCFVENNRYISCETEPDEYGVSEISVLADDGTYQDTQEFAVNVVDVNEPPVLDVPDQYLEPNSGMNEKVVDLWNYTQDPDTSLSDLNYSMDSQSNTSVVNCQLDSNRYLDCDVMDDVEDSYSEVSIRVSDGYETDIDDFNVWVVEGGGVELLNPKCGDVVSGNVEVEWTSAYASKVDIQYSLDDGDSWQYIAENEDNDGSYTWDTRDYEDQANYLLRILAKDSDGNVIDMDTTDCAFTVHNNDPQETTRSQRHSLFVSEATFTDGEEASPGDDLRLYMNVKNDGDYDLENVRIDATVHDFGERASAGPFDLEQGESTSRTMNLHVPEYASEGIYPVRLDVSNKDTKNVVYRYVTVR